MKVEKGMQLVQDTGIIAIMRAKSSDQLIHAAGAVLEGGVRVIEVTMTTPGALAIVEQAVSKFGDEVFFGAGTVLDAETARSAIIAGAQFVVAPNLKFEVIEICNRYAVPVMPGAFTPTEILAAWEAGATMVKVFPASAGGGPVYIKALKAPLPQIKMVAVGGVDLDTTADYIRAGCPAVGVGSDLINQKLLDAKDFSEITRRAQDFCKEVKKGRS